MGDQQLEAVEQALDRPRVGRPARSTRSLGTAGGLGHRRLSFFDIVVEVEDLSIGLDRLRYTLLHVAARISDHARQIRLKLDRTWPWTHVLVAVHRRLDATAAPAVC